jgi:PAS domain S-box-containing protein
MTGKLDQKSKDLERELAQAQQQIIELESLLQSEKQYELAQQQSENKFNAIINASPVPYALNDEQQNITYLNPAFIKAFGYELTDIPTLHDWWHKAYPDEEYRKWVVNAWQRHMKTAKQTNHAIPLEIILQCKDKTSKTVLASAASLSGSFEGAHLVILYDITERKKTERKLNQAVLLLENIVNSSPDLIFVKNSQLQTIFCNQAYARAVGKNREAMYGNTDIENGWDEELVNGNPEKGIRGFVHDDRDALSGFDVHNPYDPANIDGEVRIFDTHKIPLKDTNNTTLGVLGVARDITERKHAEEQLRHSQKMDALGKLTGGIAHDFNNMLGVILGYAELLQNNFSSDPKSSKYVQEIHTAGERAKALTSKLLAFSRKQPSDARPCQINSLLKRDQNMLVKTLTAKIKLNLNLDEQLWLTFLDEEMLADSILNICINSMHAMPEGGELEIITQNIHLNAIDTQSLSMLPGDYVQLTMTDNGFGMDRQIKEHIFEPFFSTKGETGTGLGMSQVYGFIKQTGGGIQVFSEPDQGTSVVMYFPPHYASEKDQVNMVDSVEINVSGGNETILVVDDEIALRELTEELLRLQGYQVLTAENAAQALHTLDTASVDLLVSDVIMPEMDGYQLAIEARKKHPTLKIQMVSGYNDKHYINEVDEILQQQQLNKPFNSEILLKRIRFLLDED